ncbi:MAG: HAD hydrolase family protein [Endomicrobia bacterium]|nr:HAD hydrolase family protein [Endomicrobiia bacterium]
MTAKNAGYLKKALKIKLIACDVDGVLTGGEIIFLNNGEEIKIWNVKDGLGYHELKGTFPRIKTAWITGRESDQVRLRAEKMGIDYLVQNCMLKKNAFESIMEETGLSASEIAYIGDDIIDIPVLKLAGFSACPNDANPEVKKHVDYVSGLNGGSGVVREVIEIIMKACGEWKRVLEKYK